MFTFFSKLPIGEGPMTQYQPIFHVVALAIVVSLSLPGPAMSREETPSADLPRPAELEPDVQFWIRIYSEVDTHSGLIHDSRHLGVVYESIDIPSGLSNRSEERLTEKTKKRYREILKKLAAGRRSNLSKEEARVLALWPEDVSDRTLREASGRLRFQLGQADKFRAGVIRSGAWRDHIAEVLEDHDLPPELAALPHVESSFTPWAYSRVGASGLWQFTRSTGSRFMRIDHVVDERRDPHRSTVAAARLLKQNRKVTGSWPLAITAYNHGASGMRRAARKLGTQDIVKINRNYRSRTFGFASRNFYPEFLAANEVSSNYRRYFGRLVLDEPESFETFQLQFYTTPESLCSALGIDLATFKKFNPALAESVWKSAKRVPKHFDLHVPTGELDVPTQTALDSIASADRFAAQTRDQIYRVRRGDTLSTIARRYRVGVNRLVATNGLRSRHRIRIGQKLRIPDDGNGPAPQSRAIVRAEIPSSGVYVVRKGDSIARIAQRFGMAEVDILAVNRLRDRNRIYVGQTLNLRDQEKPSAKTVIEAPTDHHPDAVATFSSPPSRPPDMSNPTHVDQLAEAAAEPQEAEALTLLADPNDYRVTSNSTIEVQGAETLGHYAEWLGIQTSRLRSINRLAYGRAIAIGQRVKLDLSRIDVETFEVRRMKYHQALQEDFFERYEIDGTLTHVTRRGDSIWVLAERKYGVPLWLLRQYNPDLDFAALQRGTRIVVPELKARESWTPENPSDKVRPS
jgi:membrane-bound lytic murein transglycosylase D